MRLSCNHNLITSNSQVEFDLYYHYVISILREQD